MSIRLVLRFIFVVTALPCLLLRLVVVPADAAEPGDAIAWARENISAGRYQEANEILQKVLPAMPAGSVERHNATLVLSEGLRIVGKWTEAIQLCDALLKADSNDVAVRLIRAELDNEIGNYQEAKSAFDKIILDQPDNERAWALRSIVLRTLQDRENLKKTADHFFDLYQKKSEYFNSDQVKDPMELAYIGLGILDENPKDAFETGFSIAEELVHKRNLNEPAVFLWAARLAHEKYAFASADERYSVVLKMRPNQPDALAGRASILLQTMHNLDGAEKLLKEALSVNPNHIDANLIYAAIDLEEDRFEDAKKHIDTVLAVNPNHIQGLALLAFYHIDMAEPQKLADIEKRAMAVSPKCADFYCGIGEMMEDKRGYNTAAEYYQKAIAVDPDNWRGYYGLGMNTSRQGASGEEQGKALLLTAFNKNKFNLWASNMIKSLDSIIGDKEQNVPPKYAESKTRHFTLKYFGKEAAIVRPYMEEWAESAYDWQTKKFGFEPEGPLSIELCYSFQDQAARTVGLPDLGALGVCFGKLCTVVSPREGKGNHPPFNWRKVLEHEFGHVMTLQLSKFRVPRWYTEAFSTFLENDSRIQSDRMMIDAIAKGRLKNIDKMNEYFRMNPLMAYVHGRYVIEFIDKNFGFDAHVKALKLFAEGKKLDTVLPEVTGKSIQELNEGQLSFLRKSFEHVRVRPSYDQASWLLLELAAKDVNATPQALADFGIAQLAKGQLAAASVLAGRALEINPGCVDAFNILGMIAYQKNDLETAKQNFEKSTVLDPERSFSAWHRLGIIFKKEGKTTRAIGAFEAARKSYPRYIGPDNPHHELPDLYADLEPPQFDKALNVWRDAVQINSEDPEAALKGLQLAARLKDWKAVTEFATSHIEIDPYKVEVHRVAGKAFEELKDLPHALREYGVATALESTDVESWVGLTRVRVGLKQYEEALKAAERALEVDATHAEAKALRDELKPKMLPDQ